MMIMRKGVEKRVGEGKLLSEIRNRIRGKDEI
jgi:hypothetical protein